METNKIFRCFGIFLVLIIFVFSLNLILAQDVFGNYDNYQDYNYAQNTMTNYDSRLGSSYNSQYNDPYFSRYPTNYNSEYPDYYNRYDGGYNAYGSSFNPQFTSPGYSGIGSNGYGGDYGSDRCVAGQDLILEIAPGGCSPAVVRSDLLEEQNVPVFCKVMAIKINPLIDISRIRSIRVKGEYPPGVSSVSYYPARAVVGTKKVFDNSIFEDNLGYLVIVLAKQPVESDMSDYVQGNITAVVDYLSEGVYGIGDSRFYLSEMSDEDWYRDYKDYSFWNGRGYIRVDSVNQDTATISIYRDADSRQSTINLREGQTSQDVFLSGYYCAAGMSIRVDEIGYPTDSALLQINDEQIWVAKGDRIINTGYGGLFGNSYDSSNYYSSSGSCRVIDLEVSHGGGSIKIKCPGNDLIELNLNPHKVVFRINEKNKDASIGDEIAENIFLSHVGQDKNNQRYVVLIKDEFSFTKNEFLYKEVNSVVRDSINEIDLDDLEERINSKVKNYYQSKLEFERKEVNEKVDVAIIVEGKEKWGVYLDEASIAVDRVFNYDGLKDTQVLAKNYYDMAISEYEDLISLYPAEKRDFIDDDEYAAQALLDAARLSRTFGMDEKAQDYYRVLLNQYPDSNSARAGENDNHYLTRYDNSNSKDSVRINNEYFFIDLLDIKKPNEDEANAVVLVNGQEKIWAVNKVNIIRDGNKTHSFKITKIDDEYIDLEYEGSSGERDLTKKKRLTIKDSQDSFGRVNIKLVNINLKKQVKLSIFSQGSGPQAESQFNFKIGIEKRAIQISPEKSKEMLKSLEESIKKWEDINEKLSNVIKVMKGTCFATSAILTVKNLMNGLSGDSLSRGVIMTGSGGWNDKCEDLVSKGEYSTVHQCILDKSGDIEKDIDIYSDKVKETNKIIEGIRDKNVIDGGGIFGGGQVDSQAVEKEFQKEFSSWCKGQGGSVTLPDKQNSKIDFGDSGDICDWNTLTHEQRRDIMTLYGVKNSGGSTVLQNLTNRELGSTLLNAKNYHDEFEERINSEDEAQNQNLGIRTTDPAGDSIAQGFIKTISLTDQDHQIYGRLNKSDSVVRVFIPREKNIGENKFVLGDGVDDTEKGNVRREIGGRQVIVQVEYKSDDDYYVPDSDGKVFLATGVEVSPNAASEARRYMEVAGLTKIRKSDKKAYQNKIKNPEKLMVKYFENAPYSGLPSEVPFDIENGWYAEMTYVLSGFGKPYDESGRVVNFYVCNVGENGLIEFKKSADDICRYYNSQTGADLGFPGMSQSESMNLVRRAQDAIQQAAKQYEKDRVTINGNNFKSGTSFGGEDGRCTDFMSAGDCTLMFNVCDPVICPASRCDYGGKYRVDNVIQTGVIGSLLLCLPNYKEGVMVPICLSGVHAGLQGYVSILNSTVECLRESIESGRSIGVCDEIKSIYICDFFWKQAVPLMEIAIPNLFEGVFGQGVRGGGEYATVKTAWNNMKSAFTYFTDTYATNSIRAFGMRSTEYAGSDVGAEICKSFMSSSFGGSVDFFESLIEPDSPVQYHAWFSENPMTTATYPPTSHYKVYYHIFAGDDWGAQYVVYLKDLEGSQQVFSTGYRTVGRGYVQKGGQADETIDFTGPSGYKQLCVSVNGQEECGFGKVSTSYALNDLSDQYAQEQLEQDIQTEKECVAGTPSFNSIYQPNLQAGVESVINPQLYNQGIIRVCATDNPGKQVLPDGTYDRTKSTYDKWKEVGYCGDPSIKCWLDTESVKDAIKDKGIEKEVLDEVNSEYLDTSGFWTYQSSDSVRDQAAGFVREFELYGEKTQMEIDRRIGYFVNNLKDLSQFGTTNEHRAAGYYWLGMLYSKIAKGLFEWSEDIEKDIIYVDESGEIEGDFEGGVSEGSVDGEDEEVSDNKVSRVFTLDDEKLIRERVRNKQSFDFVARERGTFTHDEARFYYDKSRVDLDDSGWVVVYYDLFGKYERSVEEIVGNGKWVINDEIESAAKIIINEAKNLLNEVKDSREPYDGVVFLFEDGMSTGDYSYKYYEDVGSPSWFFSEGLSGYWKSVYLDDDVNELNDRNLKFARSLRGKDFEEGVKLLIRRLVLNKEGGWFANTGLTVYVDGEGKKSYDYDSEVTFESLVNDIGISIGSNDFFYRLSETKIVRSDGKDIGLSVSRTSYPDGGFKEHIKNSEGRIVGEIVNGLVFFDSRIELTEDMERLKGLRFDEEGRIFY